MLVLARRKNQAVIINGTIRVYVYDIHPGKVRLSFEAPPDVTIWREEIPEDVRARADKRREQRRERDS